MWKSNYPHRHVNAIALHVFVAATVKLQKFVIREPVAQKQVLYRKIIIGVNIFEHMETWCANFNLKSQRSALELVAQV